MELTPTERFCFELLQAEDARAQEASRQRARRLLELISERLNVPIESLEVRTDGRIRDTRASDEGLDDMVMFRTGS